MMIKMGVCYNFYMKEFIIKESSAGQRIDRYLSKLLPSASKLFIQKMIRKKNIKCNEKKTEPSYYTQLNDTIQIYFSDETIDKFLGKPQESCSLPQKYYSIFEQPVYEDQSLLVINKPKGLLTQPDSSKKIAVSDYVTQLYSTPNDTFHPAPSNRLDYNSSGIVLIPKTYSTQKQINSAISNRQVKKEYLTIVVGEMQKNLHLVHQLNKDEEQNKMHSVKIGSDFGKTASLECFPIYSKDGFTLVRIILHTGRTHQIRIQLAEVGHPLIGDIKYGNPYWNKVVQDKFQLSYHLLHSYAYTLTDEDKTFTAPLPNYFTKTLEILQFKDIHNGVLG